MTHNKRLKLLQAWHKKGLALEKASDDLCTMFDVGSLDRVPILAVAWNLWDDYTEVVAVSVGAECSGMDNWCKWWWGEANHGKPSLEPYEAKAAAWDAARQIRTVADLCELIEADTVGERESVMYLPDDICRCLNHKCLERFACRRFTERSKSNHPNEAVLHFSEDCSAGERPCKLIITTERE